jgi:AcrR family transcriptional regulator
MARPRSKTAQSKMLKTVRDIILSEGVAACSIEEVSSRSGVAKTTVYRHFGGLTELIFAAIATDVAHSDAPDTGSLRGDLLVIQRGYVELAQQQIVRELFVWMMARAVENATYAELFKMVRVQPNGPTAIALQRAIARGEVSPTIDIDLAMHLIQGPFISKRIVDNSDIGDDEVCAMVDLAVRALASEE